MQRLICPHLLNTRLLPCTTSNFTNTLKSYRITSIIAFDKAYINYMQFDAFTKRNIYYVTRQKKNADYTSLQEFALPDDAQHILKDEKN
ncbi:MAG: hypothetical protein WKG06_00645 [Segetibacter sp.]